MQRDSSWRRQIRNVFVHFNVLKAACVFSPLAGASLVTEAGFIMYKEFKALSNVLRSHRLTFSMVRNGELCRPLFDQEGWELHFSLTVAEHPEAASVCQLGGITAHGARRRLELCFVRRCLCRRGRTSTRLCRSTLVKPARWFVLFSLTYGDFKEEEKHPAGRFTHFSKPMN